MQCTCTYVVEYVADMFCTDSLRVTAPLISRLLIQQVQRANAVRQAEDSGSSTDDLTQPRPLYHLCGLALSLFFMDVVAGLLDYHFGLRANWTGYLLHGSVSVEYRRMTRV